MPYSDNLYSANDESDAESFSDELSPTDGYFNRIDMPRESLVPDPSQDSSASDDKKLLARQEAGQISEMGSRTTSSSIPSHMYTSLPDASAAASVNIPSSPISNPPSSPISSHRIDDLYSERTPLLHAPPPAYSASSTSPVTTVFPGSSSYSTFPPHQLEQGFPPQHEPESMGAPVDRPTERTPLSISQSDRISLPPFKSKRSSPCRTLIRKILFLALVVTVAVLLLTTMLRWKSNTIHKDTPSYDIPSGPYCPSATIKQRDEVLLYDFGANKDLTISQSTHQGEDSVSDAHVTTSGEIRLRRLAKDSNDGAHFTLDVRVSHPDLRVMQNWDESSRTLKISTPQHAKLDSYGPHCISLEITAWLPEDAKLANLKVDAVTLSLRVVEDVKINMSGYAELGTVTGNIIFPKFENSNRKKKSKSTPSFSLPGHAFNSRRVQIETVTGAISGIYPLYDLLGLYSQSGSITVGVFPHPVDPAAPSPARLEVKTSSSGINVHLPVLGLQNPKFTPPPRDYYTEIQSTAGSISGSFYLGSSTTIKSSSGSLDLNTLPLIQSYGKTYAREGTFDTKTQSGSTKIEVLDPMFLSMVQSKVPDSANMPEQPEIPYQPIGDDDPYLLLPPGGGQPVGADSKSRDEEGKLRALRSSHTSASGTIDVQYPSSWEGTVQARAVTGSIKILGEGLSVIREKNCWSHKEVLAKKGVDNEGEGSTITMNSVTGSLKFFV